MNSGSYYYEVSGFYLLATITLYAIAFFTKDLKIKENAVVRLVGSSSMEDIPYRETYVDRLGNNIRMTRCFTSETCLGNESMVHTFYFTSRAWHTDFITFVAEGTGLQKEYLKVYEKVCSGELKSKYLDDRSIDVLPPDRFTDLQ